MGPSGFEAPLQMGPKVTPSDPKFAKTLPTWHFEAEEKVPLALELRSGWAPRKSQGVPTSQNPCTHGTLKRLDCLRSTTPHGSQGGTKGPKPQSPCTHGTLEREGKHPWPRSTTATMSQGETPEGFPGGPKAPESMHTWHSEATRKASLHSSWVPRKSQGVPKFQNLCTRGSLKREGRLPWSRSTTPAGSQGGPKGVPKSQNPCTHCTLEREGRPPWPRSTTPAESQGGPKGSSTAELAVFMAPKAAHLHTHLAKYMAFRAPPSRIREEDTLGSPLVGYLTFFLPKCDSKSKACTLCLGEFLDHALATITRCSEQRGLLGQAWVHPPFASERECHSSSRLPDSAAATLCPLPLPSSSPHDRPCSSTVGGT